MLRTYQLTRRSNDSETYWLQAMSPRDARHMVALNVIGAADAGRGAAFSCLIDGSRRPTVGFIVDRAGRSMPIERL
jgi:hypothetical protein